MNTMREDFEAWAKSESYCCTRSLFNSENYKQTPTQVAWESWKACCAARQPVGEVVAWGVRIGDSDTWGYVEVESDADFIGKQSGLPYEKKPLYAAPPQQPERVDFGRQPTPMGWSDTDFIALGNPIPLRIFRKAVMRFKVLAELGVDVESMQMQFIKSPEKYAADVIEANRLLALIDSQQESKP